MLGGTQSLHTNSFDEALALPTEHSARIALRTQQVIAYESGVPQTIDPLAGSYFVESLTNDIEKASRWHISTRSKRMGGMLKAIEHGYVQQEIQNAAYEFQQSVDRLEQIVVGVNAFQIDQERPIPLQQIDADLERKQVERLRCLPPNDATNDVAVSLYDKWKTLPANGENRDARHHQRRGEQRDRRRDFRRHAQGLRRVQRSHGDLRKKNRNPEGHSEHRASAFRLRMTLDLKSKSCNSFYSTSFFHHAFFAGGAGSSS